MDVGLVCDACDTFAALSTEVCPQCGSALSLDRKGSSSAIGDGARPSTEPFRCPACRAAVPQGFKFCGQCGTRVDIGQPAGKRGPKPAPAVGAPSERKTLFFGAMQAAHAKLVLIKGDGLDGVSYTLAGRDHIAGRGNCPLTFPDDAFLSPEHANFAWRDGKLVVEDMTTPNGVFMRIRGPVPLPANTPFLVGEQLLVAEPCDETSASPDANGTYFYASPRKPSKLRVVQLLRGGALGLARRATGDSITLGRQGNDINFPDDPFISGKHARVSTSGAGFELVDLGSKNGTYVRLGAPTELKHGDYVFIGQQLLRVEIV